jgi:hypothetical protein
VRPGLLREVVGMGAFSKNPVKGVAPKSAQEVREALLAVNRDTAPYIIRDGTPEGVDLVAEWRILDEAWHGIFGKAGLTETFRVFMRLDERKQEVRTKDERLVVRWSKGIPALGKSLQRGQINAGESRTQFGFTEQGQFGKKIEYRFNTRELKGPLQEAVTGCGWRYHGLAFRKV